MLIYTCRVVLCSISENCYIVIFRAVCVMFFFLQDNDHFFLACVCGDLSK